MHVSHTILHFYPLEGKKAERYRTSNNKQRTGIYVDHMLSIANKLGLPKEFIEIVAISRRNSRNYGELATRKIIRNQSNLKDIDSLCEAAEIGHTWITEHKNLISNTQKLQECIEKLLWSKATKEDKLAIYSKFYPEFSSEQLNRIANV